MKTISDTMRHLLLKFLHDPDSHPLRVHGNGFLQVNLDSTRRIHIWDPRLPRQKVSTQVHDHRFSFTSHVFHGTLGHFTYDIIPLLDSGANAPVGCTQYHVYSPEPREGEDTELTRQGDQRYMIQANYPARWMVEGISYKFSARLFHESQSDGLAITLMEKTEAFPDHLPRVMCPVDEEPDNEFNRYFHEDNRAVWKVFGEAVQVLRAKPMWAWNEMTA